MRFLFISPRERSELIKKLRPSALQLDNLDGELAKEIESKDFFDHE